MASPNIFQHFSHFLMYSLLSDYNALIVNALVKTYNTCATSFGYAGNATYIYDIRN